MRDPRVVPNLNWRYHSKSLLRVLVAWKRLLLSVYLQCTFGFYLNTDADIPSMQL
jgi:hypothetical protein